MTNTQYAEPPLSPLRDDIDAKLPAAAYLRYEQRADGWSAGRQAAFLAHLANNGVVADAARCVGMSLAGGYALRRQARGYAFNLGWEAALIIARRIVADNLMTAAIRGEESRWVREDGVTTYVRQNTKLSLALLDRVNPAIALPEVLAVATRFDCFLEMIDEGLSAQELWAYFFNEVLPHEQPEARARVRAALQLSEESADLGEEDEEDEEDSDIEYKSMDGAPGRKSGPSRAPVEIQHPTSPIPSFVIPAKAGIHHRPRSFRQRALHKLHARVMDSRLRGNDECLFSKVSSCEVQQPLASAPPKPSHWQQNQIRHPLPAIMEPFTPIC
jgi:hypothetical protein